MPGLRLLLRMAPFVVGAVAVGVWLRHRGAERKALPAPPRVRELSPEAAVGEAHYASSGEPVAASVGEANFALNGEGAGSGGQVASGGQPEPTRGFQKEPIDIVTVVDDLLQAGR